MVYIIILNWNNPSDTIHCLNSITNNISNTKFKIVICDNGSKDDSIIQFINWYSATKCHSNYLGQSEFRLINVNDIEYTKTNSNKGVYLIDIKENLGYAKGNNIGIQFALNQPDMDYVWILNNDTEVENDSLSEMLKKFAEDNKLGICGSKLIYFHDRNRIQGVGGKVNSWLCSVQEIGSNEPKEKIFDEENLNNEIDYVIGASVLIAKNLLKDIGLLSEDYFLYFEELDICSRAKQRGFTFTCAQKSIVYHKQGATAGSKQNLSLQADYSAVRNRLIFTYKFYPWKLPVVYLTLFIVLFNRVRRKQYGKAKNVLKIMLLNVKKQKI